jgi:hypothetical protein
MGETVKKRHDIHLNPSFLVIRITQFDRGTKPAFHRGRRRTDAVEKPIASSRRRNQQVRNVSRTDAAGCSQCQEWRGGVLIMIPILAVLTVAAIAFWFVRKDREEDALMREHYLDVGRDVLDQRVLAHKAKKAA